MLNVLLIDPPFPERPWDIKWLTQFPPKGLMYLAAYLRNAGANVNVLDTKQLQYEKPSLLSRSIEEIQQFVRYYINGHPDFAYKAVAKALTAIAY